jgi:hypothetical protein
MNFRQVLVFIIFSFINVCAWASGQWSVFEDLLYWRASQETTSPWAYQQTTNSPPGAAYTEPNVYFNWQPGVRVGALYEPSGYFDAKLYWTYYSSKARESITAPAGQFFLPEFFNGFTALDLFNAAQLDWKLIMNMVDFEVGHRFAPTDSLTVRPFLGIKGGTINQSIHSAWQANFDGVNIYSAREDLSNNFFGVGPSFGVDGVFAINKQLAIRSDLSAALMWGRWNVKDTFHRPRALLGLIPETTITSDRKNSKLGTFMANYFLGLDWTVNTKGTVVVKAGYEMQFWSNQLRLPLFQALPVHGDLTLQGATCGIFIKV